MEIRLLLITEKRDLIQFFKVHFVVTAFDCKDENSFGFSLFVDVRFKLCSVLLIWIKHSLLFRNTVEPPLTTTSTQRPPTATSLQWPPAVTPLQRPFFFLADTVDTLNLVSTSLQRPSVYNGHFLLSPRQRCSTVLRNNSLLLESNDRPHCFFFFYYQKLSNLNERKRKEKKGKQNKAPKRVSLL